MKHAVLCDVRMCVECTDFPGYASFLDFAVGFPPAVAFIPFALEKILCSLLCSSRLPMLVGES